MNFLGNSLDYKTYAKNINSHLTAQAHQWCHIVVLSSFAQENQLKATIRLTIIYNFRAVRDTETSQGPLRHSQLLFSFNTLKHFVYTALLHVWGLVGKFINVLRANKTFMRFENHLIQF